MKFNINLLTTIIYIISAHVVRCSENVDPLNKKYIVVDEESIINDLSSSAIETQSSDSYIYVDESSQADQGGFDYIILEQNQGPISRYMTQSTQSFMPQGSFQLGSIPLQTAGSIQQIPFAGRSAAFGDGGRVQWLGGPVDFDSMVDCKFYRQNPGFCVPMSMYTPCSRCKAGVKTILRTSYRVRCPGKESFPPQLRQYFVWVPTSHRNPKRERSLFSRWRRQFMCIVMAVSPVPRDLSQFWQSSQISIEQSNNEGNVPFLLSPYTTQQTLGFTTGNGPNVLEYYTTFDDTENTQDRYFIID